MVTDFSPVDFSKEEKEITLSDLILVRRLWPFIKPYFWMLCLSTVLVFIVTLTELALPLFTQRAFDGFIVPISPGEGTFILGWQITSFSLFCRLFAAFILTAFAVDFIQTLFMEYTGQKIIYHLRCRLFSHMTDLPVAYFDKHSSGRLVPVWQAI